MASGKESLLSSLFRRVKGVGRAASEEALVARPNDGPTPLSFGQEGLWLIEKMLGRERSSPYNEAMVLKLSGEVQPELLRRCLAEVVRRHEIWRTTFEERDGHPVQIVRPPWVPELEVAELGPMNEAAQRAEVRRRVRATAAVPYDLARGPLLRPQLLRFGPGPQLLIIGMPHLIFDGLSVQVLIDELSALYPAFATGSASPLAEPQIQFRDYARWQRAGLTGAALESRLAYWTQTLAGVPTTLELPTDRPRPSRLSYRGERHAFALPDPLLQALRGVGQRERATPFVTLFAAYAALLWRYSRQDSFVLGIPASGRRRDELQGSLGFFVNMLPIRVDLDEKMTFQQLLGQLRGVCLGAYEHQDDPFDLIVPALRVARDQSRNPIFQVIFQLQDELFLGKPGGPVEAGWFDSSDAALFDLNLQLVPGAMGLVYSTDLWDAATMERMVGHYQRLLEGVAADPSRRACDLPLLGEEERRRVVVQWNQSARPYPREKCVHQLVEAQVDQTPDAVAVELDGKQMSYRELDRRSNQVAHVLRRMGVKRDVAVGLAVERSFEMVVGMLGILKAGGAYLPLDPSYPAERLKFMVEDAAVSVLIGQERLVAALPPQRGQVLRLDADLATIDREPNSRGSEAGDPEQLAYVLFTSGSTGRPKGACVPHRGIVRLLIGTNYIDVRPNDVFLQLAPLAFDLSTFEVWGPLLNGGKLVLCPPGPPSLEEVGRLIRERGVTVLWLTSALFHKMVDHQLESLATVRYLIAGGDVLSVPHVRRVIEETPCTMVNGYGPTENTTFTCCYEVPRPFPVPSPPSVLIGPPIANTTAYVLDPQRQPVPIGIYGELWTGGDGVARGYWNRAELTAERFVENPFGPGRLYRTGDQVRWLSDGNIEFRGRTDAQVKVRGFRVEMGEIEAALALHPEVRQVAVTARSDGAAGEKQLVAYLVGDRIPAAGELRTFLKDRLPVHMIPSAFVTLEALPMTTNGKLDRGALPAPGEAATQAEPTALPSDDMERAIADAWSAVLGRAVDVNSNFFDLGGSSLQLMEVHAKLKKTGVDLMDLFTYPTIASLAEFLRGGAAEPAVDDGAREERASDRRRQQEEQRKRRAKKDPR
jgi:amino acid adenylation domain-containing protein